MKPAIAVISPDTLAAIGLSDIVRRMMPGAEIVLFRSYAALQADSQADAFFHYFVAASEVLAGAAYFLARQHKTIVLVYGSDSGHLPHGFHTLNVCLPETELVRTILMMAHHSHGAHGQEPEVVRQASRQPDAAVGEKVLTPREREVLKGIVEGLINKEIAARLGVSLATVITHRKNLTAKLGTRSVSALTIFAVTRGIVRGEDI